MLIIIMFIIMFIMFIMFVDRCRSLLVCVITVSEWTVSEWTVSVCPPPRCVLLCGGGCAVSAGLLGVEGRWCAVAWPRCVAVVQ